MDGYFNPALLPPETTLVAIWLLGASLGLTACTATCLPFIGTWVLARGGSHRQVMKDTGLFIVGRIAAYGMLGAVAGSAGMWLSRAMHSGLGNLLIGLSSIAAGYLLLRVNKQHAPCSAMRGAKETPPLILGFSLSLTPCAPLASLLAVCAAAGSVSAGLSNGVAFGVGAAITPLLILLPLINLLGKQLRENRAWIAQWIRWGAAIVLIVLGLRRVWLVL